MIIELMIVVIVLRRKPADRRGCSLLQISCSVETDLDEVLHIILISDVITIFTIILISCFVTVTIITIFAVSFAEWYLVFEPCKMNP